MPEGFKNGQLILDKDEKDVEMIYFRILVLPNEEKPRKRTTFMKSYCEILGEERS